MVKLLSVNSINNGRAYTYKSSFYSEAKHDIKQYRKSDDDFSYLLDGEPIEDTGKQGYKNPGWKAIHQFCKAVDNKELTRDDFGLYDVADEHQEAYYYLCGLKSEDMGDRVLGTLDRLHKRRDQQIRDRDYDPNSKGKFRTSVTRRPGNYTYPTEQVAGAIRSILDGSTIKEAAAAMGADYSHLANVLKTKYKFEASKLIRANNSSTGKKILDLMEELGITKKEASERMGIESRTASNYTNLYNSGEPTVYELSAETRSIMKGFSY